MRPLTKMLPLVLTATNLLAGSSPARTIERVGAVALGHQVAYGSSTDFTLKSPCERGGPGCTNGVAAVPAGTLLVACMWNFYRGFAPPDCSSCPCPTSNVPLPITPPPGWRPLDHLQQQDPFGSPRQNDTPGGYDEFYLFYKIADGGEGSRYSFTTTQCPEDQTGVVVGFSGVDEKTPFDPGNGDGGHSFSCSDPTGFNPACPYPVYNPVTIPGLVTHSANEMLWACIIDAYDTKAIATPPGFKAEWPYWASGTCCDIMGFDTAQIDAGPTGNIVSSLGRSGSQSKIDNWFAELIAIRPADARPSSAKASRPSATVAPQR